MSRLGLAWNIMTGKVDPNAISWWSSRQNLFSTDNTTVDYARNDYELFRSLYFASVYNGRGKDYQYAAAFAKPIVNSTAAFTIGNGVSVEITAADGSDQTDQQQKAQEDINRWLEQNKSLIYDWARHSYRDGDGYVYVDELAHAVELDADTVTVVLDTTTGDVIGFDVVEVVEERLPDDPRPVKYKITKQYRRDSIVYYKVKENASKNDLGTVIYKRVFTEDGLIEPTEDQMFLEEELVQRPLPVVHYANEQEPRQIYGNSDYQNLLALFKSYTMVLLEGTKGVIYNSTPIPVLRGVSNAATVSGPSNVRQGSTAQEQQQLPWGQDNVIYLTGDKSDAKFLQTNGLMDDVGKLLEYYFYLIVQASETPEFVFGTAVTSSKASTETQLPVMLQKAERKRTQLTAPIEDLVRAYIDRQISLSNTLFTQFRNKDIEIKVVFPDLVDEDKKLNLEIVQFLVQENLIKDETALKQLMGDKIADATQELKDAKKENEQRVKDNAILPDTNRLDEELNTPTPKPNTTKGVSNAPTTE